MRASALLLSMFSPVLQKMICGHFSESVAEQLVLHDVDEKSFRQVLNLWCGKDEVVGDLKNALALAAVADRFDVVVVKEAVEDMIKSQLDVESCADLLMWSDIYGLRVVEDDARKMILDRFDEVAKTEGFKRIDANMLRSILDEDSLFVSQEEGALEGLLAWMKGRGRGQLGLGLLKSIRFGLMREEYLRRLAKESFKGKLAKWVKPLVREALMAKSAQNGAIELMHLGPKALNPRLGGGVRWERYADGGQMMLSGHHHEVQTVAFCDARVYSGCAYGFIRVWNRATLEHERTLDNKDQVNALAVWEGLVISGHGDGYMAVWSIATGKRKWEVQGHDDEVKALKTVGSLLVSASWDGSVKVWAMQADSEGPWQCKKTLMEGRIAVSALETWEGKVMGGADDGVIWVWDAETGALEAQLTGHEEWVTALLVHDGRLFSASRDGTIRAWALGTWESLGTGRAYDSEEERYPRCLAVSGGRLVSGSGGGTDHDKWDEVLVWDTATLECKCTLQQPGDVHCLVSVGWEVWGGVGKEVVVWGRDKM